MAGLGDMKLRIGADASDLSRGLRVGEDGIMRFNKSVGTLQDQLKRFQTALQASTNPASIERLNRAIEATKGRIDAIKNVGSEGAFNKLKKSADSTLPTLTNLGRVIQDAPFGILGIANNIDPLISSFQQLQGQTGSTSGALKSLGASLIGPAGIAIGISAITSALIAFGPELKSLLGAGKVFQVLGKASADAAEASKKASIEFGGLVRAVNDGNTSLAQQKRAFEEANDKLRTYGVEIKSLEAFQNNGARIGAIYADIKREEARASALATESAKEYAKIITLQNVAQNGGFGDILGELSLKGWLDVITGAKGGTGAAADFAAQIQKTQKNIEAYDKAASDAQDRTRKLIEQLRNTGGVSEVKAGNVNIKPTSISIEKPSSASRNDFALEVPARLTFQQQITQEGFFEKKAADYYSKYRQALQKVFGAKAVKPIPLNVPVAPIFKPVSDEARLFSEQLGVFASEAAGVISQGIGQALTGDLAGGLRSTFKGLLNLVGDFLIQLGKAAIQQGVLLKLLKAGGAANPISTIAGGVAAVALGSILKSFTPRFATGVQNFTGGTAIVGERGPEVVQLPRGSNVIPNDRLGQLGGNQMLNLNVEWVLRGDQLVALVNRTQANNRRNFG
jgi:hypothetical protein